MISPIFQIKEYRLWPKRSLGQSFLISEPVLKRIIKLGDLEKSDIVVEIGAGLGWMTKGLALEVKKVIALEIDEALVGLLKNEIITEKNVEVIEVDALGFDYQELAKLYQKRLKIISNLPFNISTPLVFKLLEVGERHIELMVLMFQKEVAQRIVALPGSKDYGILSVISQTYAQTSLAFLVSKNCFYPKPKVDSAVVKFLPRKDIPLKAKERQFFKKIVKGAFSQRRKTLANALGSALKQPPERIKAFLYQSKIDPKRRAETLSLEEFLNLTRRLADLHL